MNDISGITEQANVRYKEIQLNQRTILSS